MPAVEVFEEIDWSPKPLLKPGMDYHDGRLYITIPLLRNLIAAGKKGQPNKPYKEMRTFTISSDRVGFWYDTDALEAEGFLASEQLFQESEARWSTAGAKGFLDGANEAPDSALLHHDLREMYVRYVEFTDEMSYDLMAYFAMYTYVFRLFGSTGYVHFNGTAASGKSRNLAIIDAVCFNAVWASSMSAASLYRKLAGSPGTTCIDESEGFEGERGEELRRILNAGYKDGAKAIRTEKTQGDRYAPVEYDVFGPKALASINPLEPVIASRCIVINMRPAMRDLGDFNAKDPEWQALRDRLYLWAMANAGRIADLTVEWSTEKKRRLAPRLIGRAWEITSQFIILADLIGGEDLATTIIGHLNTYFAKQQSALDATDRLRATLRALPRVLAAKAAHAGNYYSTKDIHEIISSFMEEDAKETFKTKHVVRNMDTLGFTTKVRGAGGVRIALDEDALRKEFRQRRVEPYSEDIEWLAGKVSYQNRPHPSDPKDVEPWWEPKEDDA